MENPDELKALLGVYAFRSQVNIFAMIVVLACLLVGFCWVSFAFFALFVIARIGLYLVEREYKETYDDEPITLESVLNKMFSRKLTDRDKREIAEIVNQEKQ